MTTSAHLIWLFLTVTLFLIGTRFQERDESIKTSTLPQSKNSQKLSKTRNTFRESRPSSPQIREKQNPDAQGKFRLGTTSTPGSPDSANLSTKSTPGNRERDNTTPLDSPPTLTSDEINTLVQTATKGSSPIARRLAFDQLLSSLDESTAIPIRTALARNKADGEQWSLFDYAWSAGDPSVVEKNLPKTAEKHRQGFISNSLPGWAFADPVAAAEFVNDYEPGPVQDHFRNRLIEGLADNDIDTATDFVTQLATDNHPGTPQYVRTVATEVLETQGLSGLQKWTAELPQGPLQKNAQTFLDQKSPKGD